VRQRLERASNGITLDSIVKIADRWYEEKGLPVPSESKLNRRLVADIWIDQKTNEELVEVVKDSFHDRIPVYMTLHPSDLEIVE